MARAREGDWFAVPLPASGYAVGLVARAPRRGDTLLGYFFGPIRSDLPRLDELGAYSADDAVLVARFFDKALVSGQWPTLASSSTWKRRDWPMPSFHMVDSQYLTGRSFAVEYSEDNPARFVMQREISYEQEPDYPPDELLPPSHVEHRVAEALDAPLVTEQEASGITDEGVSYFLLVPTDAVKDVRRQLSTLGFEDVAVLEDRNGLVYVVASQRGDLATLRSSLRRTEKLLAAVARNVGGQYDGPEWALPR